MSELTAEYLREILHYDPETGVFTWKKQTSNNVKVGDQTGNISTWGYVQIYIRRQQYAAHRLAWFYAHGRWPNGQIDHVNRVKTDNRLANLREVTAIVNCQNRPPRKENPGAYYDARISKWRSIITVNKKRISLGYYASADLATEAYLEAKANFHSS